MPSGVGARVRAIRVAFGAAFAVASLVVLAAPARAQAAPTLTIQKVAVGADVTATFEVTGPNIDGTATLSADALDGGPPAVASPPLTGLEGGGNYLITETQPAEGLTPFDTTFSCVDDENTVVQSGNGHQVLVTLNGNITCTFTNTLAGASIVAHKIVTGDTSSWVRPARFHITCPALQLDMDIEPPVGPGGPGTYTIGQGAIPPATCTISEIDTGSDGNVTVSMVMTNHGTPVAFGTNSLTFTSHVGDDLVLTVTDAFPPVDHPFPGDNGGGTTTTTVAGGSTTTTTAPTTTVPNGGATTTVPNGGATTSTPGGGGSTAAPSSTPNELPTTGSPAGGLLVAALVAMLAGLALVARTRRFVD